MSAESGGATKTDDRILVITRMFDAPRETVFKAWTEPERLAQWWGPKGFKTAVIGKLDLRPGGRYRFHMVESDGTDHWQQGEYREVIPPERLVCTYEWADADGNRIRPQTLLTVTFEDVGGKTRLTVHQAVFESATARDLHQGGWNSTLDRLADYVAQAR